MGYTVGTGVATAEKIILVLVEEEEVFKLGLCATLLAPSSIDAWRTIWGVGV